jgi:hypothetical protein
MEQLEKEGWGNTDMTGTRFTAKQARAVAETKNHDRALSSLLPPTLDAVQAAAEKGLFKVHTECPTEHEQRVIIGELSKLGFRSEVKREPGDGPHSGYDYLEVSW